MNTNENPKHEVKSQNINKHISAQKHLQIASEYTDPETKLKECQNQRIKIEGPNLYEFDFTRALLEWRKVRDSLRAIFRKPETVS